MKSTDVRLFHCDGFSMIVSAVGGQTIRTYFDADEDRVSLGCVADEVPRSKVSTGALTYFDEQG